MPQGGAEKVLKKTERITRRHTPREVRPFRVYGQPTKGDNMVTSRVRYHCEKKHGPNIDKSRDPLEHVRSSQGRAGIGRADLQYVNTLLQVPNQL